MASLGGVNTYGKSGGGGGGVNTYGKSGGVNTYGTLCLNW